MNSHTYHMNVLWYLNASVCVAAKANDFWQTSQACSLILPLINKCPSRLMWLFLCFMVAQLPESFKPSSSNTGSGFSVKSTDNNNSELCWMSLPLVNFAEEQWTWNNNFQEQCMWNAVRAVNTEYFFEERRINKKNRQERCKLKALSHLH